MTKQTKRWIALAVLAAALGGTLAGCCAAQAGNPIPARTGVTNSTAAPTTTTSTTTTTTTTSSKRPSTKRTTTSSPVPVKPILGSVKRVKDGDTLTVEVDGYSADVRALGIDTPEMNFDGQGNKDPECGAELATSHLVELVFATPRDVDGDELYDTGEGPRRVPLTVEPESGDIFDKYGRLLAYVEVGEQDVGLAQLKKGLAWIYRFDDRKVGRRTAYKDAQERAIASGAGGWAACRNIFDRHRPR